MSIVDTAGAGSPTDLPGLSVHELDCPGNGTQRPSGLRPAAAWICLVRRGSFRLRSGRGDAMADSTLVVFRDPTEDCEIDHPVPGGDTGTLIVLGAITLAAIGRDDLSFPMGARPDPAMHRQHRQLLVLRRRRSSPALTAELALGLTAQLLAVADPSRVAAGLPPTERLRRRVVDDARSALAADPGLELDQLAYGVGCSPHHLSRLFTCHTGAGVAAYRMTLRTNQVLDALADGDGSLADLAAATGFADQAHLSRVVRRRFGQPPSAIRREFDAYVPDVG